MLNIYECVDLFVFLFIYSLFMHYHNYNFIEIENLNDVHYVHHFTKYKLKILYLKKNVFLIFV